MGRREQMKPCPRHTTSAMVSDAKSPLSRVGPKIAFGNTLSGKRSQRRMTRRAALTAIGAGAIVGLGYVFREVLGSPAPAVRLIDDGDDMMGVSPTDMARYMEMFNRHNELTRSVEEIPVAFAPPLNRIPPILLRSSRRTYRACIPTSNKAAKSCA